MPDAFLDDFLDPSAEPAVDPLLYPFPEAEGDPFPEAKADPLPEPEVDPLPENFFEPDFSSLRGSDEGADVSPDLTLPSAAAAAISPPTGCGSDTALTDALSAGTPDALRVTLAEPGCRSSVLGRGLFLRDTPYWSGGLRVETMMNICSTSILYASEVTIKRQLTMKQQ